MWEFKSGRGVKVVCAALVIGLMVIAATLRPDPNVNLRSGTVELDATQPAKAVDGLRAPTNLGAQLVGDDLSARVSWTPVRGATNYRVGWVEINQVRDADQSSSTWLDPLRYHDLRGSVRSEYIVRDLRPGSRYYFFVGAYHRSGRHSEIYWSASEVIWVDTAKATPPPSPQPHQPNPLARIDSVKLGIDRSANGLGYLIVRYTLPSYCYSYRDVRFGQLGDEFSVDLLIDVYDGPCAQAQHSGTLLVWTNRRDLVEGRAYTVVVNGEHRLQVTAELRSESQSR